MSIEANYGAPIVELYRPIVELYGPILIKNYYELVFKKTYSNSNGSSINFGKFINLSLNCVFVLCKFKLLISIQYGIVFIAPGHHFVEFHDLILF